METIIYDDALFQKAVDFIERLNITTGIHRGRKLILRDWQKDFIRDVLAKVYTSKYDVHGEPVPEIKPNRSTRRAVLSMGRKGGKTELAAAIVLLFLTHQDFGEPNGEIYSGAKTRDQAANLFKAVVKFIRSSPTLTKLLLIKPTAKRVEVRIGSSLTTSGSFYQALSSDGRAAHGFNPSFVIYDELAQVDQTEKGQELYDALTTGFGGRENPLFMAISTQSDDPAHILSELIRDGLGLDANGNPLEEPDPTVITHLYTAPAGCRMDDEEAWKAANPAYGDFLSARTMRLDAAEAMRSPSKATLFRLRNLNQQVSRCAPLFKEEDWANCVPVRVSKESESPFQFEPNEGLDLGLDLSQQTDLSALWAVTRNERFFTLPDGKSRSAVLAKGWSWKPSEVMEEHSSLHGLPKGQQYEDHLANGWMLPCEGKVIDHSVIAKHIYEISQKYKILTLAYDRYGTKYLMVELRKYFPTDQNGDITAFKLVDHGQGFKDGGAAVNALESVVLKEKLITDGNPMLTKAVFNATVATDLANNRKLIKNRPTAKIDPIVALSMALNCRSLELMGAPEAYWPYDDLEYYANKNKELKSA